MDVHVHTKPNIVKFQTSVKSMKKILLNLENVINLIEVNSSTVLIIVRFMTPIAFTIALWILKKESMLIDLIFIDVMALRKAESLRFVLFELVKDMGNCPCMSNCKRGCPCPEWDCNNPPTTTIRTTTTAATTIEMTTTASFDDWQIELFVINPKIEENRVRHSDSRIVRAVFRSLRFMNQHSDICRLCGILQQMKKKVLTLS